MVQHHSPIFNISARFLPHFVIWLEIQPTLVKWTINYELNFTYNALLITEMVIMVVMVTTWQQIWWCPDVMMKSPAAEAGTGAQTWDSLTECGWDDDTDTPGTLSLRRDFRDDRGRSLWLLLAGFDELFLLFPVDFSSASITANYWHSTSATAVCISVILCCVLPSMQSHTFKG